MLGKKKMYIPEVNLRLQYIFKKKVWCGDDMWEKTEFSQFLWGIFASSKKKVNFVSWKITN